VIGLLILIGAIDEIEQNRARVRNVLHAVPHLRGYDQQRRPDSSEAKLVYPATCRRSFSGVVENDAKAAKRNKEAVGGRGMGVPGRYRSGLENGLEYLFQTRAIQLPVLTINLGEITLVRRDVFYFVDRNPFEKELIGRLPIAGRLDTRRLKDELVSKHPPCVKTHRLNDDAPPSLLQECRFDDGV
jgi:hypothetical protein